jgi:hypothetical protein
MLVVSRVSGFVRDMVLSHFFGATPIADAFSSFRIEFFRRLFAGAPFCYRSVLAMPQSRIGCGVAWLRRHHGRNFLLVMW